VCGDRSQHIERAANGDQIVRAWRNETARVGFEPQAGLHSINRIDCVEHGHELCEIAFVLGRDDVKIEHLGGCAVESRRHSSHNGKLHVTFAKRAQNRQKITARHLAFGSRGSHSHDHAELQALRRCQREHPADQRQVDTIFNCSRSVVAD
jgi:hypothetical protein